MTATPDSTASPFLDEALRIGRVIAAGALTSNGKATWLADEFTFLDGRWQGAVTTVGPNLASGTAGIGWLLARLAAIHNGDEGLASVAAAATRHSLDRAGDLVDTGRLDWHTGASGAAWIAIDVGRALDDDELVAGGERIARAVIDAVQARSDPAPDAALVGGESGVVAGLLALAGTSGDGRNVVLDVARRLAGRMPAGEAESDPTGDRSGALAGLARGLSGPGLALSAAAALDPDESTCRAGAYRAFAAERRCLEPGTGWLSPGAHPWVDEGPAPAASWCRGAAGIGIARIAAHAVAPDLVMLAEATAAIEFVRTHLMSPQDDDDASLCHGAGGAIELLLVAGSLLGEPVHLDAARRAGHALTQRFRTRGRYGAGIWPGAHNPSLLYGLAGTAALLVRLHDPDLLPSPALFPLEPPRGR